jgi:hypothetical protein
MVISEQVRFLSKRNDGDKSLVPWLWEKSMPEHWRVLPEHIRRQIMDEYIDKMLPEWKAKHQIKYKEVKTKLLLVTYNLEARLTWDHTYLQQQKLEQRIKSYSMIYGEKFWTIKWNWS